MEKIVSRGVPWSFFEDGNLALDPSALWVEPPPPRLKVARTFDTVAHDMPSSRPTRRRRVERREVRAARRARRFALLTLLAIVLVIALALTAFGGNSRQLEALAVGEPRRRAARRSRSRRSLAMHGVVRLQMPIAQNQFTAIGFHSATDGAIPLAPIGPSGERRRPAARVPQGLRRRRRQPGLVPARRRHAVGARRRRAARARTSTRRSTAPSSASRRTSSAASLRDAHRHPAAERTVAHRLAHAAARRSVAHASARTSSAARRARHRRRISRASSSRRSRATRTTGQPRHDRDPPRSVAGPELRVLFLADVFGVAGRRAVEERLPALREELGADVCIVNGENIADGAGITGEARRQAARVRRRRRDARQPHLPPRRDRRLPRARASA